MYDVQMISDLEAVEEAPDSVTAVSLRVPDESR